MRYQIITQNDATIIHDEVTGLYWEGKSDQKDSEQFYCRQMTREEFAVDYINELNAVKFGGYNDWRVPTKYELRSLMN